MQWRAWSLLLLAVGCSPDPGRRPDSPAVVVLPGTSTAREPSITEARPECLWRVEKSRTPLDLVEVGPSRNGLRGRGPDGEIYAVGSGVGCGIIFHREAEGWTNTSMQPCYFCVTCKNRRAWASPDGDLECSAYQGRLRWRTKGMMPENTPEVPTQGLMKSIWGTTARDVYAVGEGGTIVHFDGTAWSHEESGTTEELHAVEGDGKGRVFVVGARGTILSREGNRWVKESACTTADLLDFTILPQGQVIAVGKHGTVVVRPAR